MLLVSPLVIGSIARGAQAVPRFQAPLRVDKTRGQGAVHGGWRERNRRELAAPYSPDILPSQDRRSDFSGRGGNHITDRHARTGHSTDLRHRRVRDRLRTPRTSGPWFSRAGWWARLRGDRSSRPDAIHQFVLGDEFATSRRGDARTGHIAPVARPLCPPVVARASGSSNNAGATQSGGSALTHRQAMMARRRDARWRPAS
jgi:hypothetical protein